MPLSPRSSLGTRKPEELAIALVILIRTKCRHMRVSAAMASKASEGGEWFMAMKHVQVETMFSCPLRAAGRQQGHGLVVISFYGLPSIEFNGGNLPRCQRPEAMVTTLQLHYI